MDRLISVALLLVALSVGMWAVSADDCEAQLPMAGVLYLDIPPDTLVKAEGTTSGADSVTVRMIKRVAGSPTDVGVDTTGVGTSFDIYVNQNSTYILYRNGVAVGDTFNADAGVWEKQRFCYVDSLKVKFTVATAYRVKLWGHKLRLAFGL